MMVDANFEVLVGNLWPATRQKLSVPISYFHWQLNQDVTVGRALVAAAQRLSSAGLDTPRLDGEVLLAHVLGWTRARLYAYPERPLTNEERTQFEDLVERRFHHEPVAYLVGKKSFYGLELTVDERVLIPRPETELLVDLALELIAQAGRAQAATVAGNGHGAKRCPITVADVGVGSGAISLAIADRAPEVSLYALDISQGALELAQENAWRHGLSEHITFLHSDLLQALPGPVDLIVANLPYVADGEWETLMPDVADFEPSLALAGGEDGLAVIRRLLQQAPTYLRPQGAVLLEIGAAHGVEAAELAVQAFPDALVEVLADYGWRDRIVRVQT